MSININYKKIKQKTSTGNFVLFVDEKFNSNNLKKYITSFEFSYINDLLKNSDLKKKIFFFELSSKKK